MSFIIFGSSCFNLLVKEFSKAFNTRLSFADWSDDRLGETILKGFPKFGKREWPSCGRLIAEAVHNPNDEDRGNAS